MEVNYNKTLLGKEVAVVKTDSSDDNITLTMKSDGLEIKDNNTQKTEEIPLDKVEEIKVFTKGGNDTIHVENKSSKTFPIPIKLFPGEGNDLIIGSQANGGFGIEVNSNKSDLVLPDNSLESLELNKDKIKDFNEANQQKDGVFKSIQRSVVYFFGRDMKLPTTDDLKGYLDDVKNGNPIDGLKTLKEKKTQFSTTKEELDTLKSVAQPGDIMLRFQKGYPLDKLFVGTWQHAGIYHEDGKVVDAMGNGTYQRTLEQFGEADGIVLLRPTHASPEQINKALSYAYEQIGKQYSVDFDDNTKEQYCSGLVHNAYKNAGIIPEDHLKGEIVHPDKLLNLPGVEVVWTNREDLLHESLMKLNEK